MPYEQHMRNTKSSFQDLYHAAKINIFIRLKL